jgi:hypothetical protein
MKAGALVSVMMGFVMINFKDNNAELLGYERINNPPAQVTSKSLKKIINHFKNKGTKWINGNDPDDDVTFAVIKCK